MYPIVLGLSILVIVSPLVGFVVITSDMSPQSKLIVGFSFTLVLIAIPLVFVVFGSKIGY